MNEQQLLTTREVGNLLRLQRRDTVTQYLRRGILHGKKVGRQWLIDASSVQQLLPAPTPR